MMLLTPSDKTEKIFQLNQIPKHTDLFVSASTGSGKSILISRLLLKKLQKTPQDVKD